jgi:hypothetical protein
MDVTVSQRSSRLNDWVPHDVVCQLEQWPSTSTTENVVLRLGDSLSGRR